MLDALNNAYAMIEQLNISVTGLIVIAVILALAFLFSVREAATWFFKVDDLKRDIARLSEVARQMDSQIGKLQTLMTEIRKEAQPLPEVPVAVAPPHISAPAPALPLSTITAPVVPKPFVPPAPAKPASRFGQPLRPEAAKPEPDDSGSFPITH